MVKAIKNTIHILRIYKYGPYIHIHIHKHIHTHIYIYGKCLGFALNRNDDGQRIIIIIIIIITIIIINLIFPSTFVDLPN